MARVAPPVTHRTGHDNAELPCVHTTKTFRRTLTPRAGLRLLVDGNRRFVNNLRLNRNLLQQVNETSEGQYPFAIVLSCIDSRTSAD